ncbi:MAG: thiamine pyrophosphate-dependent enzyme [Clostridiales bacterium]|nr:thiamine pyrophosphate-dependent enzyme [Clostridiales bacterium]
MNKLYEQYIKTDSLPTLFCPGCGNGIIQVAAINAIHNLGIKQDVACVSGIGCSAWIPCYLKLDVMHTLHGRAIAFAEGLKFARPDKKIVVFTGDGDCLAIGGNHLIHAARRNIDLTIIMVNNYIYGMTGGQKSPATPKGSLTKTSPFGSVDEVIDGCDLVMTMGASYVARWTTAHPVQLEKAIRDGILHNGFSFIEVLSQCPVQAGKNVYGEKDAASIMRTYKNNTYIWKDGTEAPKGKIRIGTLRHNKNAKEYIEKADWVMAERELERR